MKKRWIAIFVLVMVFLSTGFAFAGENASVTIVNPVKGNTLYTDNLLVSIKLTEPTTINISVSQKWKVVNGANAAITLDEYTKSLSAATENKVTVASTAFGDTDTFTSTNNLSFYTKKLESISPGIYEVVIATVDGDGKTTYTNRTYVEIKPKSENPTDPAVFESQQSGTAQLLKGLLKSIFGN